MLVTSRVEPDSRNAELADPRHRVDSPGPVAEHLAVDRLVRELLPPLEEYERALDELNAALERVLDDASAVDAAASA